MSGGLAVVATSDAPGPVKRPRFRIFISYAAEDATIAEAIGKCFKTALGRSFAEVNLDKWFLQAGVPFKAQIETRLEESDVLVIVYSGVGKPSHGYTGWEVGYFDRLMKTAPDRSKVSFYLDTPPPITSEEQGISLKISRDLLQAETREFEARATVAATDPLCVLIGEWQKKVAAIGGFEVSEFEPYQDPVSCVRNLKLEVFRYLKTTDDIMLKPQKQITIRARGNDLMQSESHLPPAAELVPVGSGGSMAIFGLPDENTTWERFLESTSASRYRDSWRDAITSVVMSSLPNKIDVDNSQVIVSNDEKSAYRIILTTAIRKFDDSREFNLYFVETMQTDHGDRDTTLLLKGLELVCRFRFLFLERDSDFSPFNVELTQVDRIPDVASRLQRELNLMHKDSLDAGLDQPRIWARFVPWEHIEEMAREYRPKEEKLRTILSSILGAKGQLDKLVPLRQQLSEILRDLEDTVRPHNKLLLKEMAGKLQELGN